MVKMRKWYKYSRYFLFVGVASLIAFISPGKFDRTSTVAPHIHVAQADVPSGGDSGDDSGGGGDGSDDGDCDDGDGGDCD